MKKRRTCLLLLLLLSCKREKEIQPVKSTQYMPDQQVKDPTTLLKDTSYYEYIAYRTKLKGQMFLLLEGSDTIRITSRIANGRIENVQDISASKTYFSLDFYAPYPRLTKGDNFMEFQMSIYDAKNLVSSHQIPMEYFGSRLRVRLLDYDTPEEDAHYRECSTLQPSRCVITKDTVVGGIHYISGNISGRMCGIYPTADQKNFSAGFVHIPLFPKDSVVVSPKPISW